MHQNSWLDIGLTINEDVKCGLDRGSVFRAIWSDAWNIKDTYSYFYEQTRKNLFELCEAPVRITHFKIECSGGITELHIYWEVISLEDLVRGTV